jgi:hypothetical protein
MSTDWLAQLAPEHAPPAPAWWPPAPGWWVAAAFLLAVAGVVCWRLVAGRVSRGTGSREAALAELEQIRQDQNADGAAPAIQRLLRRYALTVFERERVAPLSGQSWIRFLSEHGAAAFAEGGGEAFLSAAYGGPHAGAAIGSWLEAAERFIRQAPRASAAAQSSAARQSSAPRQSPPVPQSSAALQSSAAAQPLAAPRSPAPPRDPIA